MDFFFFGRCVQAFTLPFASVFIQAEPPRADRIQVKITAELEPPTLRLNDDRFEAALKEVTRPIVPAVEPDAITDVEPLHRTREVQSGRFEE